MQDHLEVEAEEISAEGEGKKKKIQFYNNSEKYFWNYWKSIENPILKEWECYLCTEN